MTKPVGAARFSQRDWLLVGFGALRDQDAEFATMEHICARAGRTRGGFYAHFTGIEDFWLRVADAWRTDFTDRLIDATGASGRIFERRDLMNELAARLDPSIELGIRRLAFRLPAVCEIVAAADRRRVSHLARLYRLAGYADPDADALARIEYASFVGLQQTEPGSGPPELRILYAVFLRLTGR